MDFGQYALDTARSGASRPLSCYWIACGSATTEWHTFSSRLCPMPELLKQTLSHTAFVSLQMCWTTSPSWHGCVGGAEGCGILKHLEGLRLAKADLKHCCVFKYHERHSSMIKLKGALRSHLTPGFPVAS